MGAQKPDFYLIAALVVCGGMTIDDAKKLIALYGKRDLDHVAPYDFDTAYDAVLEELGVEVDEDGEPVATAACAVPSGPVDPLSPPAWWIAAFEWWWAASAGNE